MGEQIRAEDWLPKGWKIEIRVRKTGKKDRYYIDPTNGYIFRSLKDIDRYLLTGKLGRHVTKTKPKDLDSSDVKLDMKLNDLKQEASKKKKLLKSTGTKKSSVAAQEQKAAGNSSPKSSSKAYKEEDMGAENSKEASKKEDTEAENSKEASKKEDTGAENSKKASKKEDTGAENSKEMPKKRSSTSSTSPSKGKTSRPSRKRKATPFFILDPDQCDEEGSAASIPNLSEIIDSMQKEREGHNTVYISAPAIGALLGRQFPKARTEQDYYKPQFSLTFCREYKPEFFPSMVSTFQAKKPNFFPSMLPTFQAKKQAFESPWNIINPNQESSHDPEKSKGTTETQSKNKEVPEIQPAFGDLLTDPCIDFAIRTLTGSTPLGSEPAKEDCYFQQQFGSPMIVRKGSSCQN